MDMLEDDHGIGSEDDTEANGTQQQKPHSRLACIQCRQRKIGCNREDPCSGCIKAQIDCVYGPRQRAANKRQRIHLSDQYEKRIESIESQLTHVIDLLGKLTTSSNPSCNSSASKPPLTAAAPSALSSLSTDSTGPRGTSESTPSSKNIPSHGSNPQTPFEGDSSLTAHATFANSVLERAVSVGPMETPQPEMEDTLANLRTLVEALNRGTSAPEDTLFSVPAGPPLEQFAMPPIEAVMVTLRMVKENPLFEYISFNFFLPNEQFMDYVIKVYFPGGYDLAEFIIVNACLMDYFFRRATFEPESSTVKQELQGFGKLCEDNLVVALQRLPVYMPNTLNYIMALLLGVFYFMRSSKTCIAWTLTTTALQMCQTSGIHRIQSMKSDTSILRNQKIWTFWMLYSIEKGLSLRLGRPSTVQDYDITIPIPDVDPFHAGPLVHVSLRWIKLSQVQGKIYKGLYSPAGLAERVETRSRWAEALAEEMRVLYATMKDQERQQNSRWRGILGAQMEMCDLSEEVMFLSTMTIVLRAVPVPPGSMSSFTSECIDTARKALESHQRYFDKTEGVEGREYDAYLNWTILYTPFVPFIVIFCHIVESCVATDLPRLQAFVQSLEGISSHSESIAGMYRYFGVLYKVASRYTEMKAPRDSAVDDAYRDFDAYVHALGLISSNDEGFGENAGFPGGVEGQLDGGQMQGYQLGEWFNSNQQLMGLMEENLF